MKGELRSLIRSLRSLSADEIARVEQFLVQMRTTPPRGGPVSLRAVTLAVVADEVAGTADADAAVAITAAGADAQAAEAQPIAPHPTDRDTAEPHAAEPHAAEPNAADPNAADPHAADPRAADPNAADSPPADPTATEPVGIASQPMSMFAAPARARAHSASVVLATAAFTTRRHRGGAWPKLAPDETLDADEAAPAPSSLAHDPGDPRAVWRRRPFQAIDDQDLAPIAALYRAATDSRAAGRQRFGMR